MTIADLSLRWMDKPSSLLSPSRPGLDGRVAIVTGAASGIGRATARRLAAEGSIVAVVDIRGDGATEAARDIASRGVSTLAVRADVRDITDVENMVSAVLQEFGQIDILVNNAYSGVGAETVATTLEIWNSDIAGSLTSAFLCCRSVLPGMCRRQTGVVVNVASVNGLLAFGNDGYSAAKAGLISLTQNLAITHGRDGIRVNAVAPGTVRTGAWTEALESDPGVLERLARAHPLGRVGEPDDIAAAITFLASDDASWITGTTLVADGGLTAGNAVVARDAGQPGNNESTA